MPQEADSPSATVATLLLYGYHKYLIAIKVMIHAASLVVLGLSHLNGL